MNDSLLSNQAWRIQNNPQALWVRVLKKGVYFPDSNFLNAKRKRDGSWAWNRILHAKNLIRKEGRWLIATGASVHITKDNWLGSGGKLNPRFGSTVQTVEELIDGGKAWNRDMNNNNIFPHLQNQIYQTPISWSFEHDLFI
ncbi:hypothetical protein SESBI_48751 [Sesbania bispinosa]|nr:hypothetical protein SESBI_48751 [Sesbania bispinosa]